MKDNLYEKDFYSWIRGQIDILKAGKYEMADIENIIEELEDMGNKNADSIESFFVVIVTHLLKWQYQSDHRSNSWKGSITNGRTRIRRILKKNPGLKSILDELYSDVYSDALAMAVAETGIEISKFPSTNPWSKEEVMSLEYWPMEVEK